ncbi:MAG: hypothetical protein KDB27_14250 [Planctomycetales bacterium]|nr:hypothetical protein [Planctomycetales bacterium]
MKSVAATFLVLFGVGWVCASSDAPARFASQAPVKGATPDGWRRTKDGWENASEWRKADTFKYDLRAVHPSTVAVMTLLASLAGLIACCPHHATSSHTEKRYDQPHKTQPRIRTISSVRFQEAA